MIKSFTGTNKNVNKPTYTITRSGKRSYKNMHILFWQEKWIKIKNPKLFEKMNYLILQQNL